VKKINFKLVARAVALIIGIIYAICIYVKIDGISTQSAYMDIKKGNYEKAIKKLEYNSCADDTNSKALLNYAYFLKNYGGEVNYPKVDKLRMIQNYNRVEIASIIYLSPSKESRYYPEIHSLYEKVELATKEAEKEYIATKPKEKIDSKKQSDSKNNSRLNKSKETKTKRGSYTGYGSSRYSKRSTTKSYDDGYEDVWDNDTYDRKRYRSDRSYASGVDDAMEDDGDW